jgi:hypothetical protein
MNEERTGKCLQQEEHKRFEMHFHCIVLSCVLYCPLYCFCLVYFIVHCIVFVLCTLLSIVLFCLVYFIVHCIVFVLCILLSIVLFLFCVLYCPLYCFCYPLANEFVKGYSNATVRPSRSKVWVKFLLHNILVNTLESTSFNGF